MTLGLLAAVLTFSATATGVEKGTPLEFFLADAQSDRDYETLFLLDDPLDVFCRKLEAAGFPRGKAVDSATCQLWPVGVPVKIEPSFEQFVEIESSSNHSFAVDTIYTGGLRLKDGSLDAATNMPMSALSFYTLAQSPFLLNGIFEQGQVYGLFKAKQTLKKGVRQTFRISWDETMRPQTIELTVKPGSSKDLLKSLYDRSKQSELDVLIRFDERLTVDEATAVANALAVLDSPRIKINGRHPGELFYRAFLPLTSWKERQSRLTQPFEITPGEPAKIVFIEEDWSGEGTDPKLTERRISFGEMKDHPKTDAAFIFASKSTTVSSLNAILRQLPNSVINHYVFSD